jgi:FKBP-type peptidyl-prolyl cis-trans isomerase FklB
MKKILYFALALFAVGSFCSCMGDDDDDSTWETYADWRETNLSWLNTQAARTNADGTPYYTKIQPSWDPSEYVLMHYYEDPTANAGNLQPLYTSSCKVNYQVHLYNDTLIDSGASYEAALNSGLIDGWAIALMNMHVGDTAQIVMPYQAAYGATGATSIYPYSALRFNIRLLDITNYETRP